jgi:hypothetical protein
MAFVSILLFFLITWGSGFGATFWMRNHENFFERNLMRIGIGLGIIPLLLALFNFFHVPISQYVFIAVALAGPVVMLAWHRKLSLPEIKLTKSNLAVLIAVLIFFASLFIYSSGAFNYPYLEDDDPWVHATAAAYVADAQAVHTSEYRDFQYMDPYPPGYDGLMGLLLQSNDSAYWTLKFFNALIISLSILFFYFFAREFTGSISKSLIATFVLASVPCYLSHFIWAHALSLALFFPAAYCIARAKQGWKWLFPAAFIIASMLLSEPTTSVKLIVMLGIFIIARSIASKKVDFAGFAAMALGLFLSLPWWLLNGRSMFNAVENIIIQPKMAAAAGVSTGLFSKIIHFIQSALPYDSGTASRAYTFSDFFFAQHQNMINNPIGIGVAVSILAIAGIIFACLKYKAWLQENGTYLLVTLCWLTFAFLGVNSMTFHLPIGLFAFRFWMILAIPVALLAAEGIMLAAGFLRVKMVKAAIIIVLLIAITLTSGQQKYSVNTAQWPPGAFWTSVDELQGYMWLHTLPAETRVLSFITDEQVIGFDKYSCGWCKDESDLRKRGLNITGEDVHSWMLEHGYQYLLVGGMEVKKFGQNATDAFLGSIQNSGLFSLAHQTNGLVILKA